VPKISDDLTDDDLIDDLLAGLTSPQPPNKSGSFSVSRDNIRLAPYSGCQHAAEMGKRGDTRGELRPDAVAQSPDVALQPRYISRKGVLFEGDCLDYLPRFKSDLVDTVFADPPFNLGKTYGGRTVDSRTDAEYVEWCQRWLRECVRVLTPGGSLFVYNLPKWNLLFGAYLMGLRDMQFRHSIAIEMKSCLPIPGRLYPAHYSLLYFTKGKPKTFRKIRTPIETCRHCGGEIRDYGGHRGAMNPLGVNLKDVWTDIPPVRHWKFKNRGRRANALSTKVLDRVVEMTTRPGDVVLDPFGRQRHDICCL
jgi:site-specific DNA-methyltransferase (adenine-specific)